MKNRLIPKLLLPNESRMGILPSLAILEQEHALQEHRDQFHDDQVHRNVQFPLQSIVGSYSGA